MNLDELEKLAKAANTEFWYSGREGTYILQGVEIEYITAFDPDTILKLVAVVRAADILVKFLDEDIGMDKTELTMARSALVDLEEE